ncbi:MAG: SMC-Scp complex subunit ScpB [Pseudomonadota bacterium]
MQPQLKQILQAALMCAEEPLTLTQLQKLFLHEETPPTTKEIKQILVELQQAENDLPFELKEIASGYRYQVKQAFSPWIANLYQEKPPRYSRALLETLALIAYKQPITRAEIEEVRGVSVSSHIIKTLLEREWIKAVGHRDVPGKPTIFATTKDFLDYFNLKSLAELPALENSQDLEQAEAKLQQELALEVKIEKTTPEQAHD